MSDRTARILLVLGAFIAGLTLFGAVTFIVTGRSPAPVALRSSIGGPFQLVDQRGQRFTDQELKGKPHLVFFGFTHCPDICPTTLFETSEILRALGKDADRVGAVFVTVDPERDTPPVLKDYLSNHHPHIVALTDDPAAGAAIANAYQHYFKNIQTENGYTMDHTA